MLPRIVVGASSRASWVPAGSDDQVAVEIASSPSDVALKGRPFLSADGPSSSTSAIGSGSTDHPRSPILPAGLEAVPPESRLPSILPRSKAASSSDKLSSASRRLRTTLAQHDELFDPVDELRLV